MAFKMKTPFLQQYLTEFEEHKAKEDEKRRKKIAARNAKLNELAIVIPKMGMCSQNFFGIGPARNTLQGTEGVDYISNKNT
tara:strand:- start:847 stop:1089 length:243 start_codon:yes stop_codon:yes gene_type:complete